MTLDDSPDATLALAIIDDALQSVHLERSLSKTEVIEDARKAAAKVQDSELGSIGGALKRRDGDVDERVHQLFDTAVIDPDGLQRFRFAVRSMQNRGDRWAADEFARKPALMEIDPTTVGRYLGAIASRHPDALVALLPLLQIRATARTAAVQVHLLRAASCRQWGESEGRLFERVHDDAARPEPIRWWAAEAIAATPTYDLERCVADVSSADRPQAARLLALPVRRTADDADRRTCARHLGTLPMPLAPTVAFLERRADPVISRTPNVA